MSKGATPMSKKHFNALAAEIAKIPNKKARHEAACAVARVCGQFSQSFNGPRFFEAANAVYA